MGRAKPEAGSQASHGKKDHGKNTNPSTGKVQQQYSITDPVEKHRAQAVATHDNVNDVIALAKSDPGELVREASARRCAQLLEDTSVNRETLLAMLPEHRSLFFSISTQSNSDSLRSFALDKAETDEDLLTIAAKTRFHDTRLAASQKLVSIDSVDRCWRSMKTKDKLVTRELKAKLDKHRDTESEAQSRDDTVNKILDEMEKIANGVLQPGTVNRFDHFTTQWKQLDFEPAADQLARYNKLHNMAAEKAEAGREKQSVQDQRQSVVSTLEALVDSLDKTTDETLANRLPDLKTQLKQQQTLWATLESQPDQSQSQLQHFNTLNKTLSTGLKKASVVLQAQQVSDKEDTTPQTLKKTAKALEELKADSGTALFLQSVPQLQEKISSRVNQKTASDKELKQQIHKQLASLNSAIAAKRWGPAKSIQERLAKKVSRLDAREKASYSEKLARLEAKVNELGDWTEFASEPKLSALCEQMEKLPSLKLSPNDCANQIKELQTRWKAMGASPAQQKLWPRFKEASDIAYEPCGKFFTARREERKAKLKARKEICQLLEDYEKSTDWNQLEWRAVEKVLRTAKQDWKANQVFDKKQGRALEDRFTKILKLIDEKLDPVYEANAEEKRELIARVSKLGEGDINQHSVNQVKSLMSAWRLSGVCRPKDDKVLWQEFRTASNKIYDAHRGRQREQQAAGLEHVRRAREIIKTIAAIKNSNEAIDENSLSELQTEFTELPDFPERDHKRILREYQKALDSVDRYRQSAIDNNRKRAIETLHHNAGLCQQLETLFGQPADQLEAGVESVLSEWQTSDKGENPKAAKAIEARRDKTISMLQANETPDYENNTLARRLLCIELEILTDRETPTEDKAMRMQHQLEQLQNGLQSSSTSMSKSEQKEALHIRWLTAAPASPDLRDKLESRFAESLHQA